MLHLLASLLSYIDKKDMETTGYIPETEVSIFVGYFRKPLGDKVGHSCRAMADARWWVRIPNSVWIFGVCMRLFWVCVVLSLGSGLATGGSHVQVVLPSIKNDFGTE
jgi:hypothetical protein